MVSGLVDFDLLLAQKAVAATELAVRIAPAVFHMEAKPGHAAHRVYA